MSVLRGEFPTQLKHTKIIPIFKSDNELIQKIIDQFLLSPFLPWVSEGFFLCGSDKREKKLWHQGTPF